MSTLTSILGSDLISNAPSVLNGNFSNLNTTKAETVGATLTSPSLIGTPTAPTAVPGTANSQIATTSFVSAANQGDEINTYIVQNIANGAISPTNNQIYSSIASYVHMIRIPQTIRVNQISVHATTVTTPGSIRWGLYDSTGQTQIASTIFASITGVGMKTNTLPSVMLSAKNYYQAFVALDGLIELRSDAATNIPEITTSVFGKPRYYSSIAVVAGALPASFSPSSMGILSAGMNAINTRFDN